MTSAAALRIREMGDRALLVELGSLEEVHALAAALRGTPVPGQTDVVPAARTVLIRLGPDASPAAARRHLRELSPDERDVRDAARQEIPVVYDGEDLGDVAALLGMSRDALVARHSSFPWTVAFTGFAPGFAYLVSPESGLRVPRRATPRTAVPAGSVALAGEFSGIYPRESPGGWQLVGRTDAVLWDVDRDPPSLLAPGDTVVFRPVRELVSAAPERERPAGNRAEPPQPALTVLAAGLSTTVQDRGRSGWASAGVSPSGAADRPSYAASNAAVGNLPGAAALETTFGGLRMRAERELVVAVTGAPLPVSTLSISGERRGRTLSRPFALRTGEVLELGVPGPGLRNYVAIRGGVDVPAILGSRSTDTLSGLGPPRLRAGDVVAVGTEVAGAVADALEEGVAPAVPASTTATLRYRPGPRDDWFDADSRRPLEEQTWTVTPRSDRVGVRLEGRRPLERSREGELVSEGMVPGAVQVPPDGQPVLFLADHPVTGGYPVIGVVVAEDLALAAQLAPGGEVRFVPEETSSAGS